MNTIKYLIPLSLLCCKAKVQHEKKCKDTVIFDCRKDTSEYHWSDNFTDLQLRELCRENKIVIK